MLYILFIVNYLTKCYSMVLNLKQKQMIPNNIFNFLQWIRRNTTYIQANVVRYNGIMYFLDRRTENGRDTDAGLDDLWNVYVKDTVG